LFVGDDNSKASVELRLDAARTSARATLETDTLSYFRRRVLSWLIPFVVSFLAFPFGTLMDLVVLSTGAALLHRYFRNRPVSVNEAVLVGMMWLALNLAFEYPMFAYRPMKMPASTYYSEIGLGYLTLPAFAFGGARLARS
jgi:hypothetical protein